MTYDFETLEEVRRLEAKRPEGFIGDAIYRDDGELLVVSITGITGTRHTGTLPKTEEVWRYVQEKHWRKFGA